MIDIILASTSPRRKHLLALSDLDFSTYAVDVDEKILPRETPQDYIVRMVQTKAREAADSFFKSHQSRIIRPLSLQPNMTNKENNDETLTQLRLLITADTIGVLSDDLTILVKPKDKQDAIKMWSQMSGKQHYVWTAVQLSVINKVGHIILKENLLEKTAVLFINLDKQAMENYWETGEPQDKAGGYAIQGRGGAWVERINGSYSNVVGLPLAQTLSAIKRINELIPSIRG